MNRLVLLGNGFDLAHGLKTSYKDFIIWYLRRAYGFALADSNYEDDLLTIIRKSPNLLSEAGFATTGRFVDFCYQRGFGNTLEHDNIHSGGISFTNPFRFNVKAQFVNNLLVKCTASNWVDIENEYYSELKRIQQSPKKVEELNSLNLSLKAIIENLEIYLTQLSSNHLQANYITILKSDVLPREMVDNVKKKIKPERTMILNFNYTSTILKYVNEDSYKDGVEINYIHGKLGDAYNPIVFGFGDELDEDYKKLELDGMNKLFEYIKSFWYFKTSNYYNLIRFIDSMPYQVQILGHSCGLSDRTMLNMIFEHGNCKSIKVFYHGDQTTNNYTSLTQEISRHFRDKREMRRKIVSFNKSAPMPQATS